MTRTTLPPIANAKFAAMLDEVETAQTSAVSVQRRIKGMEDQVRNNPASASDMEPELARQRARLGQLQSRQIDLTHVTTAISTWLMQLGSGYDLRDVPPRSYERYDGETYIEAVDRIRRNVADFRSSKASVQHARLPDADLFEAADAYVEALRAKGRPEVRLDPGALSIKFRLEGYAADAVALLAWLDPDTMKARLHLDIEERLSQPAEADRLYMSLAERELALLDIEARALAQEREEEQLICEALSMENTDIPRRRNAPPGAILGVEVVRAERKLSAA
ncbi:hypothetical protein FNL55_03965 [Tardiphaga sp. vice352]|uniref:hypothetical protein n=1 Tax=unclassified Tardiphaga TaxID=2631404 RepID=UPI00116300FD|nr:MULTISPECIES: hypothetical protein [unclassified Tardiphaga]QDM15221.1 hypothetical protein FNL53_04025 [Tardiphaga sp. vice278]QDM25390.1 hypothetical protein FNL56_03890 [Tardiphaga sp. vice304]QDM30600.1 hypothetical protein FNL55_03965 [Tardiphaga sp. vice352]